MQSVSSAFTAEASDPVRKVAHSFQVSWHKESTLGNRTFTIGVSTIGGNDVIGINTGSIGSPGIYQYFDESDYVMSLGWERSLNTPVGGISKALAEARLDNTSGRFTPRSMGGVSELATAIVPRRPALIGAGFEIDGVDSVLQQFAGIITRQPEVDRRTAEMRLQMADYIEFFENRFMDETAMFTGQTSDQIMEYLLQTKLGLATADFTLDQGIQPIPFVIAPAGTKFMEIFDQLTQAEMGYFYQDETGQYRFENRQHWDSAPYNSVVENIHTADVIEARTIDEDHIINVVEVRSNPRAKQTTGNIFTQSGTVELGTGDNQIFIDFENPVLAASNPVITANRLEDGSGANVTGSITLKSADVFAQSAKYVYTNNSGSVAYLTAMTIEGRQATPLYPDTDGIYFREKDGSSVTAFEERVLSIQNDYIQSKSWAQSFANLVLTQFSEPESLQSIVIRAKPYLQLGDLIDWQGRSWRIFDIKTALDPSAGFVQELRLLLRTTQTYFKIDISTIGGPDKIAA